jgi:hypothetical protein
MNATRLNRSQAKGALIELLYTQWPDAFNGFIGICMMGGLPRRLQRNAAAGGLTTMFDPAGVSPAIKMKRVLTDLP